MAIIRSVLRLLVRETESMTIFRIIKSLEKTL